jgi:hypothetical protein
MSIGNGRTNETNEDNRKEFLGEAAGSFYRMAHENIVKTLGNN